MALMIDRIKTRRYPLSYEQARTVVYALGLVSGPLFQTKDPQLVKLRAEALALHEELKAYKWSASWTP